MSRVKIQLPAKMVLLVWAALPAAGAAADDPLPAGATARLGKVQPSRDVWAVAFAPNSTFLAAASGDGTVRVWDMPSGRERFVLRGHHTDVFAVAVSPDGRWLASGGKDGTVRFWDSGSGKLLRTVEGAHVGGVTCLAIAPDGSRLATGGNDRMVRLWEPLNTVEARTLRGHVREILCLAVSPDGLTLVSGSRDYTARVWNPLSGAQRHVRRSGDDGEVTLHCWGPGVLVGKPRDRLGDLGSFVSAVAFSPDNTLLALGGRNGNIQLFEMATGEAVRIIDADEEPIAALAFSADGGTLAWSGCFRHELRLWNIVGGCEGDSLAGHGNFTNTLAFSPDGSCLASGSSDGSVLLWKWPAAPAPSPRRIDRREFDQLWADLAELHGSLAHEAVCRLASGGDQAVAYLREFLRPAEGAARDVDVERMIAELDDDDFAVRERAMRELEANLTVAVRPLVRAAGSHPSLEVRRRAQRIIEAADYHPFRVTAAELRQLRAVQVLSYVGTPAAHQLLRELAQGASSSRQTLAARDILQRWQRMKGK